MRFVANTITEHYEHIGEMRGEVRGVLKGKISFIGMFPEVLDAALRSGVLPPQAYAVIVPSLHDEINAAEAQLQELGVSRCLQSV